MRVRPATGPSVVHATHSSPSGEAASSVPTAPVSSKLPRLRRGRGRSAVKLDGRLAGRGPDVGDVRVVARGRKRAMSPLVVGVRFDDGLGEGAPGVLAADQRERLTGGRRCREQHESVVVHPVGGGCNLGYRGVRRVVTERGQLPRVDRSARRVRGEDRPHAPLVARRQDVLPPGNVDVEALHRDRGVLAVTQSDEGQWVLSRQALRCLIGRPSVETAGEPDLERTAVAIAPRGVDRATDRLDVLVSRPARLPVQAVRHGARHDGDGDGGRAAERPVVDGELERRAGCSRRPAARRTPPAIRPRSGTRA